MRIQTSYGYNINQYKSFYNLLNLKTNHNHLIIRYITTNKKTTRKDYFTEKYKVRNNIIKQQKPKKETKIKEKND